MFRNQQAALDRASKAIQQGQSIYLQGDPGFGVNMVLREAASLVASPNTVLLGVDLRLPELRSEVDVWEHLFAPCAAVGELAGWIRQARDDGWSTDALGDVVDEAGRAGFELVAVAQQIDHLLLFSEVDPLSVFLKLRKLGQRPRVGERPAFTLCAGGCNRLARVNDLYRRRVQDAYSPLNHLNVQSIAPLDEADVRSIDAAGRLRELLWPVAGGNPKLCRIALDSLSTPVSVRVARELVDTASPVFDDTWRLLDADNGEPEFLDACFVGEIARRRGRPLNVWPRGLADWLADHSAAAEEFELRGIVARSADGVLPRPTAALHLWWFLGRRFAKVVRSGAALPGGGPGQTWASGWREWLGPTAPTLEEAVTWLP